MAIYFDVTLWDDLSQVVKKSNVYYPADDGVISMDSLN